MRYDDDGPGMSREADLARTGHPRPDQVFGTTAEDCQTAEPLDPQLSELAAEQVRNAKLRAGITTEIRRLKLDNERREQVLSGIRAAAENERGGVIG